VANQLRGPRLYLFTLGLFALVVVLLAGMGVFSVLAAFVAQRAREFGVRTALGASQTDLRRLVLLLTSWPALLGLVGGTCIALVTTRTLQPLLFQVTPSDSRAFIVGWTVVGVSTLVASLVPLRRLGRINPAALLRSE